MQSTSRNRSGARPRSSVAGRELAAIRRRGDSANMESSLHALAADVGGTNARFAIAQRMSGEARIVFQRTYPTKSFPDFEPALEAFLREARAAGALGRDPPRAAIAIAGAVDRHVGRLTNRTNWTIDLRELGEHLGVNARLINDFV